MSWTSQGRPADRKAVQQGEDAGMVAAGRQRLKGRAGDDRNSSSKSSPQLDIEIDDIKGENKVNGKASYQVEEVLNKRFSPVEYLVEWKGSTELSWEPAVSLKAAQLLVSAFNKALREK